MRALILTLVPSLSATGIFLVTTTLVIGVICGCRSCRTNQRKGSSRSATYHRSRQRIAAESCPSVVYEEVCIGEYAQEQAVDLTDNIAYASTLAKTTE